MNTPGPAATAAKIVVAGGYGAGKTTFVGAISELAPVTTDAVLTDRRGFGDGDPVIAGKTTTTVAMDFGRLTLPGGLTLYLFATPGQPRFGFTWQYLAVGAVGAVVLVDIPIFLCDARDRQSVRHVLVGVAEHAITVRTAPRPAADLVPAYHRF